MKVKCSHGYFFFEEPSAGDISRFCSTFGFSISQKDWYFTFEKLLLAPDFSFKNLKYIDPLAISTETFSGKPWDVMRKNKLVFDFSANLIKPIASITKKMQLGDAAYYYFSDGLILPGSLNSQGQRVTDYSGHFASDALKFRYTEIGYEQNI